VPVDAHQNCTGLYSGKRYHLIDNPLHPLTSTQGEGSGSVKDAEGATKWPSEAKVLYWPRSRPKIIKGVHEVRAQPKRCARTIHKFNNQVAISGGYIFVSNPGTVLVSALV